ncbi:transcription factor ILR3-like isoform X2 [Rutidosis leptorrhynchoides]|uniref:transcription factor ILR3-like isoform X2 n=1 Tax=Rutidosis leptorrhynchoides TaxID=125765 RepID=UPI003A9902EA
MEIDEMDENPNWLFDFGLVEDIPTAHFTGPVPPSAGGFTCPSPPGLTCSVSIPAVSEIESSFIDFEGLKEQGSRKRLKSETINACGSKAGREKLRRDRMTDRFLELCSILEHGRPPKTDKTAILSDAIRMIMQLRSETERLNERNVDLQEKIKELKAEKNELREEKQILKIEKEKMELKVKTINVQPSYLAHPTAMRAAFAAQEQTAGNKLMPFVGYPGVAMWQFMPSSVVDTSQDHVLRPPVA